MGVDGCTRSLIWLSVVASNRCPTQILHLYLQAMVDYGADWRRVRADGGVENLGIIRIHGLLRANDADAATTPCTTTGSSHTNTRVECVYAVLTFYVFCSMCQFIRS